jgi:hypothetical protein
MNVLHKKCDKNIVEKIYKNTCLMYFYKSIYYMTTKLRSGKIIDPSMDELSGLFSKSMKFITPKSKKPQPSEDDMFANMFNKVTIGKKIGKTRRKKFTHFTHKKHHKIPSKLGMDLTGGRRIKRRCSKRRRSKRTHSKRTHYNN